MTLTSAVIGDTYVVEAINLDIGTVRGWEH